MRRGRAGAVFVLMLVSAATLAASPAPAGAGVGSVPAGSIGSWTDPEDLELVGIHAVLLRTGKVLLYNWPDGTRGSEARLLDPATGDLTDVDLPLRRNIFCSGLSVLPDGRVLVTGGERFDIAFAGIRAATLFDPVSETWASAAPMHRGRWYPTNVQLPDGRVLVTSGNDERAETIVRRPEIYDPETDSWELLPPHSQAATSLYPRMFILPDGSLFRAGEDQDTRFFDIESNRWPLVDHMEYGWRSHGAAVLLPGLHRVLTAGGSDNGHQATDTAEVIDFADPDPRWELVSPMHHPRMHVGLVLLPDGTALAVGGGFDGEYAGPVREAELYDPDADEWTLMAAQDAQRQYHSTALLLPDGRVLSAGSDNGPLQETYEIFSPPYLSAGSRPRIDSAPGGATYGGRILVTSPDAGDVERVVLIRPGAVTHGVDFDQRVVDLSFQRRGERLRLTAPAGPTIAPPGYYMLFLLSSDGVPSMAEFIRVGG